LHVREREPEFVQHALHGLDYLNGPFRDERHGGLYFFLTPDGRPETEWESEKHTCGLVFAIFAAAATYRTTRDARALELAMDLFRWLEEHAHDPSAGGYFEPLTRDGKPLLAPHRGRKHDAIGTPYGYKTTNTHIHVLEALTELYEVSAEPPVRTRLEETLALLRDRLTVPPGAFGACYTLDWRALPMHDSFGHDVEAAYLMLEAAQALGGGSDDEITSRTARRIVDHTLEWGWDSKHGGVYFAGQAFGPAFDRAKWWWVQAEALNVLLIMHERHGHETDRYWNAFLMQMRFIFDHQVDRRHGGWHPCVSEDGKAVIFEHDKAMPWKAAYHDGRALMNVSSRLRRMSERRA
jgi:mannobiose 2-epimerase